MNRYRFDMETKKDSIEKVVKHLQEKAKKNPAVYPATVSDMEQLARVANQLGIPFEWLVNLINFETAGTFSPKIKNPNSSATGLIQFMANTARSLGTTTAELKNMTFKAQLVYVAKYLDQNITRLKDGKVPPNFTQLDLFMCIFYPVAMYKGKNYTFNLSVQRANPGIKTAGDYFAYAKEKAIFKDTPSTLDKYNEWNTGTGGNTGMTNGIFYALLAVGLYFFTRKS